MSIHRPTVQGPLRSLIAPPFPHDPRDRCWIYETRGWHVRMLAINDPRRRACIARGLLHLQLWNPEKEISILTPSKMTNGSFEVWKDGQRARLCGYKHLMQFVADEYGVALPCYGVVQHFENLFVHAAYLGASLNGETRGDLHAS
jgi:hypothetical protein